MKKEVQIKNLEIWLDDNQTITYRLGENGDLWFVNPGEEGYETLLRLFEPKEEEKLPTLLSEGDCLWSYLLQTETGYRLGMNGDRRLLTVDMDLNFVVFGEAVTGNDRYPPGRFQRVQLSRDAFKQAIAAFLHTDQEIKKQEQQGKVYSVSDFDPFIDSDDLP